MKKYVEYIRRSAGENYIWEGGSIFGDWLFYKPELVHWQEPDAHTDKDLIATAFYGYSTQLLVLAAQVLGFEEDVTEYQDVLDKLGAADVHDWQRNPKSHSCFGHGQHQLIAVALLG